MTKRTLAILGGLTLIAVILAVVATRGQPRVEASDQSGQILFPALVNDIEHLKSVVIKHAGETMTIDWDGKVFRFRERGGYPVDAEKVQALAVRLARLSKMESKTSQPDRYDRLDLGDPMAKGGQSTQVTLLDTNGKALADVIVGKRKFTLGGREGGTYIRFPKDPQTWLALGDLMVGPAPHDWLKRDIADIKQADIKRVTVTHANGEKVVVTKGAGGFVIDNMPRGMEMVTASTAEDFAKVLESLQLDDVAPVATIPFTKDKTTTAVFEGDGGSQVNLDLYDDGGKFWIRLKGTPAADKPESAKLIGEMNARTEGWAYQVPNFAIAVLTKAMGDLTKKPDPKGAASASPMTPQGMPQGLPPGFMAPPPRP